MKTIHPWRWDLLHPHKEQAKDTAPSPRELPGGLLAHDGSLFAFGGGTLKFGVARWSGDLTVLGSLNDLWRHDPAENTWTRLEEDDGRAGYAWADARPCGRMLPAWVTVKDRLYLFGGLTALGAGWRPSLLNDLWSYDPATGEWELVEPHDARTLKSCTSVDGSRPTTVAATGVATVGARIYIMGGWAGRTPEFDSGSGRWSHFLMSPQLWCYDTASGKWEHLGPTEEAHAAWPAKRYCPAMTSWNRKLYLWGGRDTDDRDPQFYNDLWEYDPASRQWRRIQENAPHDAGLPSPRYGLGQARIGHYWYLFGGFGSEQGDGPQLNDHWRYDLAAGALERIFSHNAAKDYSARAERPGVRRVSGMTALADAIYLFGGLDLASGPDDDGPLIGFNDLWRGTPHLDSGP